VPSRTAFLGNHFQVCHRKKEIVREFGGYLYIHEYPLQQKRREKLCLLAGVRRSNAVLLLESVNNTHWLLT
jgi:hypothetical protein